MKCTAELRPRTKFPLDTLVLFAFEGDGRPVGRWEPIDIKLQKLLADAAKHEAFTGKEKQTLTVYPPDGKLAKRIIVAGLGKKAKSDGEKLRRAAAGVASKTRSAGVAEIAVLVPGEQHLSLDIEEQAQAAAEGLALALYDFNKYKSNHQKEEKKPLAKTRFLLESESQRDHAAEGLRRAEIYARATCLTRDLVNEPAGVCTPRHLASVAQSIARNGISTKVLDEKQIRKMKMGGLEGVSLGSEEPPRFVHLSYTAVGAKKTVALVGKGITFDSGGLCLKPADGMLNMKNDMAGAGVVLGVFSALRDLKPKVNVHGIFAATENMPGGGAYKVRDVLRAMNGKTMEIVNTDAEGRLVLSDALSYASMLNPDEIIDIATLTGACVVALGPEITGVFGTDQDLIGRLVQSGRQAGEKMWPMPLEEEYWDMIKSDVADMKNSGGRNGGSITAALFLKEFVKEKISWAHLDIAGPALHESGKDYRPPGATGVMVRTLLRYLEQT